MTFVLLTSSPRPLVFVNALFEAQVSKLIVYYFTLIALKFYQLHGHVIHAQTRERADVAPVG